MPRRIPQNISRSGHIKAADVSGAKVLNIVASTDGAYRIYNTGNDTFDVQADAHAAIPLQKKSSVDVITNNIIKISKANPAPVDGIFERLDSLEPIRTGRFRGDASPAVTIVQNRGEAMYRILNSGKTSFKVNGMSQELDKKLSFDVAASNAITISRDDHLVVEAIYDNLDYHNSTRPGRFKVRLNANQRHNFIFLTGSATTVHYRIFNSGDEEFQFLASTAASGQRVQPGQSFDFAVAGGVIMGVSPIVDGKPIQGIYEYIGPL